jgi:hypothetical protein
MSAFKKPFGPESPNDIQRLLFLLRFLLIATLFASRLDGDNLRQKVGVGV